MREHLPLPKRIAEAPQLRFGLELYYAAFMDLATTRPMGMGEGVIPWHVINEYAKVYEFDDEQREDLHFYIGRMDEVYLNHVSKKAKGTTSGGGKKGIGK